MGVSLSKGQSVSLVKPAAAACAGPDGPRLGRGQEEGPVRRAHPVDRPRRVGAAVRRAPAQLVDQVWFQQLTSRDGSVQHTGDNLTGEGEGDDESIRVDLGSVPAAVQTIVFTVNSFTGQDFSPDRERLLPADRRDRTTPRSPATS